jgi:hypothetical protein
VSVAPNSGKAVYAPAMARWLVLLEGEKIDLEEYPHWFPEGDIFAITEGDKVFLTGTTFTMLADPSKVHEAAIAAVDEFSAVITLLWPSLKRPTVGAVYNEDDNGVRRGTQFLDVGCVTVRSKVRATLTVMGPDGEPKSPPAFTQAQTLLAAARSHRRLNVALTLWADPTRTWGRLYRVLEEVEEHLGADVDKAGFCSGRERRRFTQSANNAEVAGKDARHAGGKYDPPAKPMTLNEAVGFIGGLLQAVLRLVSKSDQGA